MYEFSVVSSSSVFWSFIYGIVTLFLKKLIVLLYWVVDVNIQDIAIVIDDGDVFSPAVTNCVETLSPSWLPFTSPRYQ